MADISDLKSNLDMAIMLQTAIEGYYTSGAIQSYTTPTGLTVNRANIDQTQKQYEYYKKLAYRDAYGMITVGVNR